MNESSHQRNDWKDEEGTHPPTVGFKSIELIDGDLLVVKWKDVQQCRELASPPMQSEPTNARSVETTCSPLLYSRAYSNAYGDSYQSPHHPPRKKDSSHCGRGLYLRLVSVFDQSVSTMASSVKKRSSTLSRIVLNIAIQMVMGVIPCSFLPSN